MAVYDATDCSSLYRLEKFLEDIDKLLSPNIPPILLVGNKADHGSRYIDVNIEQAKEFAEKHRLLGPMEISAKDNTNIKEVGAWWMPRADSNSVQAFEFLTQAIVTKMSEAGAKVEASDFLSYGWPLIRDTQDLQAGNSVTLENPRVCTVGSCCH